MIAYFVHDSRKDADLFVLPDAGISVQVNEDNFGEFIAPQPEFSSWKGAACPDLEPERFGQVVATRDDRGDVCIQNVETWQQRMKKYLG